MDADHDNNGTEGRPHCDLCGKEIPPGQRRRARKVVLMIDDDCVRDWPSTFNSGEGLAHMKEVWQAGGANAVVAELPAEEVRELAAEAVNKILLEKLLKR